jgi:hypothetical protein
VRELTVNGTHVSKRGQLVFGGFEAGETVITVAYGFEAKLEARPYQLYTARYGSLLFSLPISYAVKMKEYVREGVERKAPYCDYYYTPTSDWNYGFASRELTVEERDVDDGIPFSSLSPSLVLHAELSHIDWGLLERFESVCSKVPHSRRALDASQTVTLYPYGCAKLRMTELPMVKK